MMELAFGRSTAVELDLTIFSEAEDRSGQFLLLLLLAALISILGTKIKE